MADQPQIVSQPDHGDTIILKGGIPSPRLQLYFDDITKKLNTEILAIGSNIYNNNDTIGSARIATITDSLSFQNGRTGFSSASISPTDGTVHIINSLAGVITADPDGDLLVLESNTDGGLSILSDNLGNGNIIFGSPAFGNRAGRIFFLHDTQFNSPRLQLEVGGDLYLTMHGPASVISESAFNETAKDIDFRINTLNVAGTFFIDAADNRIGMDTTGLPPTQGFVHIAQNKSPLATAASSLADILVLDSSAFESGMSFVGGPSDSRQNIMFASGTVPERGKLQFKHNANHDFTALIYTTNSGTVEVEVWRCTEREFIVNLGNDNDVNFRCNGTTSDNLLYTRASQTRVGVADNNNLPSNGLLHIQSGTPLTYTTNAGQDELVINKFDGNCGMTIATRTISNCNIAFGDNLNPGQGEIIYVNLTDEFVIRTQGSQFNINSAGFRFNTQQLATCDFRVDGDTLQNLILVDASADDVFLNIAAVAVAVDDKVVIRDTSDGNALKTVTTQEIANLAPAALWTDIGLFLEPNTDGDGIQLNAALGAISISMSPASGTVFNEDGIAGHTVRMESLLSTNMFFLDAAIDTVGFSDTGVAPTEGVVHIHDTGTAGIITASTFADSLVLESSASSGLSFLNANTTFSSINFGSPLLGNDAGVILFNHAASPLQNLDISVATIQAMTVFPTGLFFNVGQDTAMNFQVNTLGSAPFLRIISAVDRMGLSQGVSFAPTDGILHIFDQGVAGVVTADVGGDAIVLESNGNSGLSILTPAANIGSIYFGSATVNDRGIFRFDNTVDFFQTVVQGVTIFQTSTNRVGISQASLTPTDGTLHILNVSAGIIGAAAGADELVIEGTGPRGMSFLVDNATGVANIAFGDPANGNTAGLIEYTASTASYAFFVTAREALTLLPTELVFNEGGLTNMDTRFESLNSTRILFIDASADRLGIADNGFAPSDGLIHVFQGGSAGVVAAHANSDTLVLESNTHLGISLLAPADGTTSNIYFGNTTQNNDGSISYEGFNQRLTLSVNAVQQLHLDPVENVFNETGIDTDLRAESNGNTAKLFLDAGIDELTTAAGTAPTAVANIGGNLNIDNSTAGTTAVVTEETLLTFTLPANSLTQNGRGVRIRAWGTTAANANLKTVRLKFGATNVLDTGAVASNAETWYFEADVYRTGAATQDAIGKPYWYVAGMNDGQITNPAETLSAGFAIVVSGQNGTATVNDIVAEGLSVEYI